MNRIHGVLSTYNLTEKEQETFIEYLKTSINNPVIEFVQYLLKDNFLMFIDIVSGTNFKVPSNKVLKRDIESVRMYLYVKKLHFTEESIKSASRAFKKNTNIVRKNIYRVAKVLGTESVLDEKDLNNFIYYIKNVEENESKENKEITGTKEKEKQVEDIENIKE